MSTTYTEPDKTLIKDFGEEFAGEEFAKIASLDIRLAPQTPQRKITLEDWPDFAELRPLDAEPVRPVFPVQALPVALQEYALRLSASLQVALDFTGPAILATASACIAGEWKIQAPGKDWVEPLNLYTLVVAGPSERKSPTLKEITKPLYEYERTYNQAHKAEIDQSRREKEFLAARVEQLKKEAARHPEKADEYRQAAGEYRQAAADLDSFQELRPLRLTADDCTPEALASVMAENGERMAIISAEGGVFGTLAGRYSNEPNTDLWAKAYDGEPVTVDRRGRHERLQNPILNVLLFAQPKVLGEILTNQAFVEKGLLARFQIVKPAPHGTRPYHTPEIPSEVRQKWAECVKTLLDWRFSAVDQAAPWPVGNTLQCSSECEKPFMDFHQREEMLIQDARGNSGLEAYRGKLAGACLRLAGILHLAKCALGEEGAGQVSADTMKSAIALAEYFDCHAGAIYSQTDPKEEAARRLLNRLWNLFRGKRDYIFTQSELSNKSKGKVTANDKTLELLIKRGYLRKHTRQTAGRYVTEYQLRELEKGTDYENTYSIYPE